MFGVKLNKALFFDRERVVRAVNRATLRALSKAGAYIRQVAKTSIRKRKGTSPPGSPPYSHEGSVRNRIFFFFEPETESVVIGPQHFRGNALEALEHGGTFRRRVVIDDGRERRWAARMVKYPARPFMGPALAKELPNLPKRWQDAVRA